MKNGKKLKEKALFLMCLCALTGNTTAEANDSYVHYEIMQDNPKVVVNDKISISEGNDEQAKNVGLLISGEKGDKFESEITFNEEVRVDGDLETSIMVNAGGTTTAKFNSDLYIDNSDGYALYCGKLNESALLATTSIIVGDKNNDKPKVQIIGNLVTKTENYKNDESKDYSSSTIELNLNNKDSFFAGKMLSEKVQLSNNIKGEEEITLNLKNGGTWYVHDSKDKENDGVDGMKNQDVYNIGGGKDNSVDGNLQTYVTSDGGVIDIYHHSPNKTYTDIYVEQLQATVKEALESLDKNSPAYEAKKAEIIAGAKSIYDKLQANKKIGERTVTLNGVGERLQNTTFRISTNVADKKADKVVLNGVKVDKDSKTKYFVEIAADPSLSENWKADKDDKILVMDINGDGLDNINVVGEESEAEIGAGLIKQIITPTVEEDSTNKGDWYLTAIDKVESKGSGHRFAEIGAAASAGMASAWRTDSADLYQRMGNLRNNEAEQGVWGRIYTGENEIRKGIGLDLGYKAVQVGYDHKKDIENGKLFTGVAFGYFDGNADYDHGSGESNSATVGVYATYSGNNGSFGDFIVKLGNIDNKLSYVSESGDYYKADYDTFGVSADAEYGYRYEFDNGCYIEPLAQLSYIYIADKDYTMNLNGNSGATVSNGNYQSLIGYAGLHYGKKFGNSIAYLRVALGHEFAGDIDVDARYQDIKVNSSISGKDTWVEYGVGFDVKVKDNIAVYGSLQRTTGDVVKNKWHASAGLRYTF